MSMLAATIVASSPLLPPVRKVGQCMQHHDFTRSNKGNLSFPHLPFNGRRVSVKSAKLTLVVHNRLSPITLKRRRIKHSSSVICAASLSARCSAEQTQTVTREAPTITSFPTKEKSPQLDDGGTGFPPRDDGDGGGGGGGGGGNFSGGFFFFGFLLFLGFLKDKEEEGPYRDKRRRADY